MNVNVDIIADKILISNQTLYFNLNLKLVIGIIEITNLTIGDLSKLRLQA